MRLFLILGLFFMAGILKADFVVQSEPTMVAYPTPQVGQQWTIKSDGSKWYWNGTSFAKLSSVTNNNNNVLIGTNAGASITSGSNNILIGNGSGQSITSGSSNQGYGYESMQGITTGSYNFGAGDYALNSISSGLGNIAIGLDALTSGNPSDTVAIGYEAGANSNGASSCVFLGGNAGNTETSNNKLHIANYTYGDILAGDFSTGAATVFGSWQADSYSVGATPTPGGSVTLTTSEGNAVWNSGIYTGISGATPTPSILSGTVTFPTNAQTPVGVSNTNITTSSRAGINEINTGSGLISETFSHNPYSGSVSFWGSSVSGPVTASYWIFP